VTLPALRDSTHVAAVALFVVVLAVTSLPVLLTPERDAESAGAAVVVRYAVGATAICVTLASTVTFLFVPKVGHTQFHDVFTVKQRSVKEIVFLVFGWLCFFLLRDCKDPEYISARR